MATQTTEGIRTLLFAHPSRFGPGKIHILKDEPGDDGKIRTLCGKTLDLCPGEVGRNSVSRVNCKVCNNSLECSEKWAERSEQWRIAAEERDRQQAEDRRLWWSAYNDYLETSVWREKRRLVMIRAEGKCEGCRLMPASQVHHLQYPSNCLPGSNEWIKAEKLFHLVAICHICHRDLHPNRFDTEVEF
jgi:hypothetical protein